MNLQRQEIGEGRQKQSGEDDNARDKPIHQSQDFTVCSFAPQRVTAEQRQHTNAQLKTGVNTRCERDDCQR